MERERNLDGTFKATHGMKDEKIYAVWCAMRRRCHNKNDKRYDRYGGRGISVCKEWNDSFLAFYEWAVSNGFVEGLTIDRINNNGNYEPSNCRWVTRKTQNRNYSKNHNVTYNGETHCIKEWSEILGIKPSTILWRLEQGKPLNEVMSVGDKRYGIKRFTKG